MESDLESFLTQPFDNDHEDDSGRAGDDVMKPNEEPLTPHLIGLDFTFWAYVFLSVEDVLKMDQHPSVPAIEKDPNTETLWWLQVAEVYKEAYALPSIIPPEYGEKATSESRNERAEDIDPFAPGASLISRDTMKLRASKFAEYLETRPEVSADDFFTLLSLNIASLVDLPTIKYLDFRESPELVKVARKMSACQQNKKITTEQFIDFVFHRAFGRLVKSGFASLEDMEQDIYELIRHDLNLGEEILKIIRNPSSASLSKTDGVMEEVIVMLLHENPRFRYVQRSMIRMSVRALEEASLIYETGFKIYRAFDVESL
ncbi:hypothetical protein HDU67_002747 [Dinochytrium kinnereticum]|nr:hypothetical protein HDU67_002747 [Dinochytrium kinnereticum]